MNRQKTKARAALST